MCGNTRVRRIPARDRIDAMSAHPLSILFGLMGAPIYHCNACRHQYHDWRSLLSASEPVAGNDKHETLEFRSANDDGSAASDPTALMVDAALQQRSER